jgi:hypothetical protein
MCVCVCVCVCLIGVLPWGLRRLVAHHSMWPHKSASPEVSNCEVVALFMKLAEPRRVQ